MAEALRPDRRPAIELTESYLPVEIDPEKLAKLKISIRGLSSIELLKIAQRELTISAERVNFWLKKPEDAPQYWAAYHADEVICVFEIDKTSWRDRGDGHLFAICRLRTTPRR